MASERLPVREHVGMLFRDKVMLWHGLIDDLHSHFSLDMPGGVTRKKTHLLILLPLKKLDYTRRARVARRALVRPPFNFSSASM